MALVIKVGVSDGSRWAHRGDNVRAPQMTSMRYFNSKKRPQPGKNTPIALRSSGPEEGLVVGSLIHDIN